ncbi:MAG: hypothetical protein ABGW81_09095 [Paracoccaceae bacterium]
MVIAIFSYWAVGAPAAYILGFVLDFGGQGIWGGLAIGLAIAAILMNWRYYDRKKLGLINTLPRGPRIIAQYYWAASGRDDKRESVLALSRLTIVFLIGNAVSSPK